MSAVKKQITANNPFSWRWTFLPVMMRKKMLQYREFKLTFKLPLTPHLRDNGKFYYES